MRRDIVFVDTSLDGIQVAFQAASKGFKVVYATPNEYVLSLINKGEVPHIPRRNHLQLMLDKKMTATSNVQGAVSSCELTVLTRDAYSTRGDKYAELRELCRLVGTSVNKGGLVIYSGICLPNTVRDVIASTLEKVSGIQVGTELGIAYMSPVLPQTKRIFVGQEGEQVRDGVADLARSIWQDIQVVEVDTIEEAEAATVFSFIKGEALKAVAHEMLLLSEHLNVDPATLFRYAEENTTPTAVRDTRISTLIRNVAKEESLTLTGIRLLQQVEKIRGTAIRYGKKKLHSFIRDRAKEGKKAKVVVITDSDAQQNTIMSKLSPKKTSAKGYLTVDLMNRLHDEGYAKALGERLKRSDVVVMLSQSGEVKDFVYKHSRARSNLFDLNRLHELPEG